MQKLKDATTAGVLVGSGKLATELDRLDLIEVYKPLAHPRIAGHGPTLHQSGLPDTRQLELLSAEPLRSGVVALHYRRALNHRVHRRQLTGSAGFSSQLLEDEGVNERIPKPLAGMCNRAPVRRRDRR